MPMRAPRENASWIRDLRACGPVQAEALTDLRELLLRGLAKSFQARLCFRPACVNLDFPWPTVILVPERKPMTWRPLCRLTPFYTPNTNSTS